MRVTSCFHNERKTDGGRNDKNMKITTNVENNDMIQVVFNQKSLPKIQSISGVTTTNKQGNAADPVTIRTQSVVMRNLATILKLSMH